MDGGCFSEVAGWGLGVALHLMALVETGMLY